MNPVLVTGATGFLGRAIVQRLLSHGLPVRATGRRSEPDHSLPNYIQADLNDRASASRILSGTESVIHAAGLAHQFKARQGLATDFMRENAEVTGALIQACAGKVAHFILLSSISVYDRKAPSPRSEDSPCCPDTIYGRSKLEAERRAISTATSCGMRLTILRLATAYGEEDPGNCARLLEAIDRRRFVWIGSGKNRKSLIHREDVAEAAVTALGRSSPGICIVNVSGPPVSMREIATTMAAGLGRELPGFRIPSSVALTAASLAWLIFLGHGAGGRGLSTLRKWLSDDHVSTDRAGSELQFKARIGLAEGIRREVEWYQSRKGCLAGS